MTKFITLPDSGLLLPFFLVTCSLFGQSLPHFSIEEGHAESTLRQFSLQAQVNLIYTPDDVENVATNHVQGNLQAREALDLLLEDTGLTFNEDIGTKAFAIVPAELVYEVVPIEEPDDEDNLESNVDDSFLEKITASIFSTVESRSRPVRIWKGEVIFELSPFEVDVSSDIGYVATNTLTGSRIRTNLSDVAASVTVFTEEFLNDTGLISLEEVALYSVGTINDIQDVNASPNISNYLGSANSVGRIRIRGIRGTLGLDYFQSYYPDDSYRAARYDESRGPNGTPLWDQ